MKKVKNNIISDWLEKYGNPEIDKQVEKELEHIEISIMLKGKIKEYCKYMGIKFIKYHEKGFIASNNISVKAGMEFPLRKIGTKTIYREYLCYKNGDIVDNGILYTVKI